MAVEDLIASVLEFLSQGFDEVPLLANRNRAVEDRCAEGPSFVVQSAGTTQSAVKSPVQLNPLGVGMSEHAHKPVFHGAAVHVFNDMQDPHNSNR